MTTLTELAKAQGVDKRTVQRWYAKASAKYGDLGTLENGVRHLTSEDVDKLIECSGKRVRLNVTTDYETDTTDYVPVKCEIVGAEVTRLDAPEIPTTVNLAKFGSASTAIDLTTVDDVLALVDQFSEVLDTDLEARWTQYNQTTNAAKALAKKVEALQEKRKAYEIETRILANLQSDAVATVKEQLGNVEALGS